MPRGGLGLPGARRTSLAFCLVTSLGVSRCTPLTVANTSGQPGIWRGGASSRGEMEQQ